MSKDTVKKFDLEAAFKALDELSIPKAQKGIAANKVNLTERFKAKNGLEALVEDYYDVSDSQELETAQEERADDVAKAKLARIEKIVDLDADSVDDLQPSYVGKAIIQCPQCMTLFYKKMEDLEPAEDDPSIVNVSEVCQHCGNDSGYNLIGKVDVLGPEDAAVVEGTEESAADEPVEEVEVEETEEGAPAGEESEEIELSAEDVEEPAEEEVAEESLNQAGNTSLNEDVDVNELLDSFPKTPSEKETEKDIRGLEKYSEGIDCEDGDCDDAEQLEEGRFGDWVKKKANAAGKAINKAVDKVKTAVQKNAGEDDKLDLVFGTNSADPDALKGGYTILFLKPDVRYDPVKAAAAFGDYKASIEGKQAVNNSKLLKAYGYKDANSIRVTSHADTYADAKKKGELAAKSENGPVLVLTTKGIKAFGNKEEIANDKNKVLIAAFVDDEQKVDLAHLIGDAFVDTRRAAEIQQKTNDKLEAGQGRPDGWEAFKPYGGDPFKFTGANWEAAVSSGVFLGGLDGTDLGAALNAAKTASAGGISDIIAIIGKGKDGNYALVAKAVKGKESKDNDQLIRAFVKNVKPDDLEIESLQELEDIDETSLQEHISAYLTAVYENVDSFVPTACTADTDSLLIEGTINFKSGKTMPTAFIFEAVSRQNGKLMLSGYNKTFSTEKAFNLAAKINNKNLITESLSYNYTIGTNVVKGNN